MKVSTIDIAGVECDVHATRSGSWVIYHAGDESEALGQSTTYDNAVQAARGSVARKKVKVHVNFVTAQGRKGFARGLHARTHEVLVTYEDGEKDTLGRYDADRVLDAATPPEVLAELTAIDKQRDELATKKRALLEAHRFELHAAVKRAIDNAATQS